MVSRYDVVRARSLDRGDEFTLARQSWVRVPPGFAESRLSMRPGVEAVYREDRPTGPLRICVHDDRVVIRRECYHPGYHPVKHLLHDVVPDGATAGGRRLARAGSRVAKLSRRVASGLGRLGTALGQGV